MTSYAPITKSHSDSGVVANLIDYEERRRRFSWDAARDELDGLPNRRGLNIAHEAVDPRVDSAVIE